MASKFIVVLSMLIASRCFADRTSSDGYGQEEYQRDETRIARSENVEGAEVVIYEVGENEAAEDDSVRSPASVEIVKEGQEVEHGEERVVPPVTKTKNLTDAAGKEENFNRILPQALPQEDREPAAQTKKEKKKFKGARDPKFDGFDDDEDDFAPLPGNSFGNTGTGYESLKSTGSNRYDNRQGGSNSGGVLTKEQQEAKKRTDAAINDVLRRIAEKEAKEERQKRAVAAAKSRSGKTRRH